MRMPIVGRSMTHDEGVALIEAWIASLRFPRMAAEQAAADRQQAVLQCAGNLPVPAAAPSD